MLPRCIVFSVALAALASAVSALVLTRVLRLIVRLTLDRLWGARSSSRWLAVVRPAGWIIFGITYEALLVLPALFVIRRTPEEMGLYPDGAAEPTIGASSRAVKKSASNLLRPFSEELWTRAEAVRTSAFFRR